MCVLLGAAGCVKSGQTGSPAEDPPQYETPGRFSPGQPGVGTPGGNPGVDLGNMPYRQGADFAAVLDDAHLVVATSGGGVLVFDVRDPSAPKMVGALPVIGRPLQLDLDAAEGQLTLAIEERTPIDEQTVPEQPLPSTRQRLVSIDVSDPTALRRIAHVDLDGDFWQFERRGGRYFVLAMLYAAPNETCGSTTALPDHGPRPRAMQVTGYEHGSNGFVELGVVELSTEAPYAFVAGDAFFAVDDYEGAASGRMPTLGWVEFGTGALVEGGGVPLAGELRAVAREGSTLLALVEHPGGSAMALHTFLLDGAGGAIAQGELGMPIESSSVALLAGGRHAIVTGATVAIVDLGDPASPRSAHEFPAEVQHVWAVPQGLLAVGSSREDGTLGRLVTSLWDVGASDAPTLLGRVVAPWPLTGLSNQAPPFGLDAERGLLLVPISVSNARPGLGVVSFGASGLAIHSQQAARQQAHRPLSHGASILSTSFEGLEVLPLVQGAAEAVPVSVFVPFHARTPIAVAEADGVQLALSERASDGRFVVAVFDAGAGEAEAEAIELDHFAEALVPAGDRVIALGLRWDSECEYMNAEPDADPSVSFDRCAAYRRRGISVIALEAGKPRAVQAFTIDSELDLDLDPIAGVHAETNWSGYVRLADGRLAFPVERRLSCDSYDSCDALGVEAGEVRSAPGCNPQVQNCDELPTKEILIRGSKTSLLVYLLEGLETHAPALAIASEIEARVTLPGEGPLDIGWRFLVHGDDLGLAREEQVYDAHGNSVSNEHGDAVVRFWLERIVLDDDGSLQALPSVSTPGLPVAWLGEHVFTLEPRYTGDGAVLVRAHRARLEDDGAYIEDSTDIGEGFLDARAVGDRLFVVRAPADPCAPDPRVDLFALALATDALAAGEALELPGRGWSFPYGPALSAQGELMLRGGPSGYAGFALVDIADPAMPRVVRYTDHPIE